MISLIDDFTRKYFPEKAIDIENRSNGTKRELREFYSVLFSTIKDDQELVDFLTENIFIAGGVIRDLMRDKKYNDFDCYFKTEVPEKIKEKLYKFFFNKRGSHYAIISPKGNLIFSLYKNDKDADDYYKVNFIYINHGKPIDVVNTFDFTINNNYFDYKTQELFIDTLGNDLICNEKIATPGNLLVRLYKFTSQGYNASQLTLLFITFKLNSLPRFSDSDLEKNFYAGSGSMTFKDAQFIKQRYFNVSSSKLRKNL